MSLTNTVGQLQKRKIDRAAPAPVLKKRLPWQETTAWMTGVLFGIQARSQGGFGGCGRTPFFSDQKEKVDGVRVWQLRVLVR